MKHIPREYLNQKVRLVQEDGRVLFGRITKIDLTFICFETKSKTSLLGIRFIDDVSLVKHSDISQSSPVESKPRSRSRNNVFQYSKWWKNSNVQEVKYE